MQNTIYSIDITKEALEDLEILVNRGNEDGLVNVQAEFKESEQKFEFTLTYKNEDATYDRHISINLK